MTPRKVDNNSPRSDADVLLWGQTRSEQLNAEPSLYGITAGVADDFSSKYQLFKINLGITKDPATRTPIAVATKKTTRKKFLAYARGVLKMIAGNPAVSDEAKQLLNLPQPGPRHPLPAPEDQPDLDVLEVGPTWVRLRAHAGGRNEKRGKPAGVMGIELYSFEGVLPPPDVGLWLSRGVTTRPRFTVDFGVNVVPGTRVWVCVRWFNTRGHGPFSAAVDLNLAGLGIAGRSDYERTLVPGEPVLSAA